MTPEGRVKKKVKEILERLKIYYYMPVPCGYGRVGKGDFFCCPNGKFLVIETKKEKKDLTELQQIDKEEIEASKGIKIKVGPEEIDVLEAYLITLLES